MLNGVPVAQDDLLYLTGIGVPLTVSAANGFLTNDFDAEGTALTVPAANVGTFPTFNGQINVSSSGGFTYTPNPGFQGVDSYFYVVTDGVNTSRSARAQFTTGPGLTGALNRNERIADNLLHSGGLTLVQPLSDGMQMTYRSDAQGAIVIPVETQVAPGTATPTSITAQLSVGGVNQGTTTYSNTNFAVGQKLRFALPATNLATGQYNWTMTVTLVGSGSGGTNLVRVFTGSQAVVDRRSSEYGPGWWFDGQDRLNIQNGLGANQPDGVLLVEGDGTTLWFAKNGANWNRAEGDLTFSTLTLSGSEYTLRDKWGNERRFDASGYLTTMRRVNDLDTPVYTYAYEPGGSKRLTAIIDQFARPFTLTWSVIIPGMPGSRVTCGSFGGGRQTDVRVADPTTGNVVVQQNVDLDPVIAIFEGYQYFYQESIYRFTNVGGRFLCSYWSAPSEDIGPKAETTFEFDGFGLLSKIKYNNVDPVPGVTQDWQLFPMLGQGLRVIAVGGTPVQALHLISTDNARFIDERLKVSNFSTNRFGEVTRFVDALAAESKWDFDWFGFLFLKTGVDADGTVGTQIAPVVRYGYSSLGNLLLRREVGDGVTPTSDLKWTYHATLNVPLTASNELNQITTMTYDAGGSLLTSSDPQGFVWSYEYDEQTAGIAVADQHGRLRKVTSPDPDGGGMLLPIVTTLAYTIPVNYLLASKVTFGDGSMQQFTYTSADQLASVIDELGRTTSYVSDDMNRVVLVTQPSVAAGTPQWKYIYGKNGQLNAELDPHDNRTDYSYDARYRLLQKMLPDPDDNGILLTRPVYTWKYNPTGQVMESTLPTYGVGIKDVFDYDNVGQMTLHTGPLHGQYTATTGQNTDYQYDLRGRLVRTKDPSGRVQRWGYDIRDRLLSKVASDPDDNGPLQGAAVNYGYDPASRLTSVRDELFRQTDYFYTANGWLQSAILPDPDSSGPQTRSNWGFGYDNLGRRTQETDPLGRLTTTGYDTRDRVISVTTPDPDGPNVPVGAGPLNAMQYLYQYDLVGNLKTVTAPLSRVTTYDYDALNRLTQVTLPDPDGVGIGQPASVWQYSNYDLVGNLKTQIDPLGRVTTFDYDKLYRRSKVTQPDPTTNGGAAGPVWNYIFTNRTLLDSVTDPLTRVTTYGYDNAGRTIGVTLPDPDGGGSAQISSVYTYAFDALDRLTAVTEPDPDGVGTGVAASMTGYQYDQRGRLNQVTDARGGITNYGWNDANELLRLTDSVGNSTQWSYDRVGRTVLETNSLGRTRVSEYDLNSNLVRATDRNGRVTRYSLDTLDRLRDEKWYTVTGAVPEVTVTTTTQGGGGANEVQSVVFTQLGTGTPGSFRLAYNGETTAPIAWDANSATVKLALEELLAISVGDVSVAPVVIAAGVRTYTITFTGNLANTNVSPIQGTGRYTTDPTIADRTLTWKYDDGGRMIEASDPAAIYQYTLDNLDRVTVETQNSSGVGLVPTVRMTRGYDLVSNRTSLAAEFVVGAAVTKDFSNSYLFDGLNRVGRITQTAQGSGAGFHAVQDKRVNLTYNAIGQFTFISRYENVGAVGTNLRSVYSYDQANRLTGLAHRNISAVPVATDLSVYGFTYDPMNRIKTIDHTGPSGGISDGQSTFNYDQTSQLTLADHAPARPDENLSYDLNGNRTNPGYTTGANNQTAASQDSTAQKYSYVYDKEGNRTRRTKLAANGTTVQGVEDYTFDHRNRLTNVTFRATVGGTVLKTVNYTYDIFNRLVKRSYDSNGATALGVTDTYFAGYDGINPTLELSKADPGAGGVSAADLKHRYLWGAVVDQLFADEQFGAGTGGASSPTVGVGNTLWALSDHLGTVRDIADFNPGTTTFTIVNHRVYDSFGKLTAESNTSVDLAFGYTGKFNDEVTQLSLHWNRWLDTNLGKWISEDPIGFMAGDANLSRYVGSSSVNASDPTGLYRIQDPVIVVLMQDGSTREFSADTDPIVIQQLGGQIVGGEVAAIPGTHFSGPTEMLEVKDDLSHILEEDRKRRKAISDAAPSGLDITQGILDIGGFVPFLGAVPDLINAGISGLRGKKGEAALNAFAAIPFWGDAVKGGKKASDIIGGIRKLADDATTKTDDLIDAARRDDRIPNKPNRKKQGREPGEKKRQNPGWTPRNPPKEPPKHTPSRKTNSLESPYGF